MRHRNQGAARDFGLRRLSRITWRTAVLSVLGTCGIAGAFARTADQAAANAAPPARSRDVGHSHSRRRAVAEPGRTVAGPPPRCSVTVDHGDGFGWRDHARLGQLADGNGGARGQQHLSTGGEGLAAALLD